MVRIKQFWNLPIKVKVAFIEASFWLIIAKLLVACLPFRWIAPLLGETNEKGDETVEFSAETKAIIALVARTVERMAAHADSTVKFVCLPQAIAGKMILKRHKIPNTLYLGVEYASQKDFKAHAWLKAGKHFVTGQAGHHKYTEITSFFTRVK